MTTPRTRALTRPPTDAGQWLTYVELATLRRIDRHSAVKLVGRHGWRRQKDNQGTLRIFVPSDWAKAPNKGTDSATNTGTERGAADIAAFETALTAFKTALTAVEAAHASEVASLREQIATAEAARIAAQAMVEQFAGAVRDGEEAAWVERARSAAQFAEERQCEARSAREASDAGQAASQAAQEWAERAPCGCANAPPPRSTSCRLISGLLVTAHRRPSTKQPRSGRRRPCEREGECWRGSGRR
jgi:hypothetical protein